MDSIDSLIEEIKSIRFPTGQNTYCGDFIEENSIDLPDNIKYLYGMDIGQAIVLLNKDNKEHAICDPYDEIALCVIIIDMLFVKSSGWESILNYLQVSDFFWYNKSCESGMLHVDDYLYGVN